MKIKISAEFKRLSVEVMEFVTMFDELLLPVLARIDRGPEIPDFGCLECRTERA